MGMRLGGGLELQKRADPASEGFLDNEFYDQAFIHLGSLHFRRVEDQTCERSGPFQFHPDQDVWGYCFSGVYA